MPNSDIVKEAVRLTFADKQLDRFDEQDLGNERPALITNNQSFNDGLLVLALSRGNIDGVIRLLSDRSGVPRELVAFKVRNFQAVQMRMLCNAAGIASLHTNILIDMLRVARRRKIPLRTNSDKEHSWKEIAIAVLNFYGANIPLRGAPAA